ncbi:MAG: phosphonate metabolism transcriptional regulator PhnF [Anaerolinea sp.]|nr:phosphonate metabolism transcriptional regulator PhnF [Anaerolinea sp.]
MSRTIDPYNALPKYIQLASILRQKIEDGEWEPRSPIPSERQLEVLYNISRTTIREAIDHLMRQGYIYREHGRGTFVSPQKLQKTLMELTSFSEDLIKRGIQPGQIIRSLSSVLPPVKILQKLELAPGAHVLRIERIRLGDNTPIGLQTSYLALAENQTITSEEMESSGSLYRILQEKFNIIPSEADETLEVTLATPEEADLLQIAEGAPLLLSERVLFAQNRKPIEFVKILYRGDRYRYYARLTR